MKYAGFWIRFGALFIDNLIISIVSCIINLCFILIFFGPSFHNKSLQAGIISSVYGFSLLLNIIYYAGFESSKWQATLGKRAFGLKVTNLEGQRISLRRAICRYLAKFLSWLILAIGFIMAGFTQRKQALHDFIVNTVVVRK